MDQFHHSLVDDSAKENHEAETSLVNNASSDGYRHVPTTTTFRVDLTWHTSDDVDLSAVLYDDYMNRQDIVFYYQNNQGLVVPGMKHCDDAGRVDDCQRKETIEIDFRQLYENTRHIFLAVNVYQYDKSLKQIGDAQVTYMEEVSKDTYHELYNYQVPAVGKVGMIVGQLSLMEEGEWGYRPLWLPLGHRNLEQSLTQSGIDKTLTNPPLGFFWKEIKIRVLSGAKLVARDQPSTWNSKATSDPYYIIKFDGAMMRSRYCRKTLEPKWNEKFFDLGRVIEDDSNVKIDVCDYDFITSDDPMGNVEIKVSDLYALQPGTHVMYAKLTNGAPTQHEGARADAGELQIEVVVA